MTTRAPARRVRQARLSAEWRRWLIDNLVEGVSSRSLVEVLVSTGIPETRARALVEAEAANPYVEGSRRAVAMQAKLESLLDTYDELHRQSGVPPRVERRRGLHREEFLERYYFQNRPVLVEGAMEDWPAVRGASLERFRAHLATKGEARALGREAFRALRAGLRPPLGVVEASRTGAVWTCPPGAHVPLRGGSRNVLLCQVLGSSHVRLLPPFLLHRVCGERVHPWAVDPRSPALSGVRLLECSVAPGELLLLPVGWWHDARATEASVCVSFETFTAPEPNVDWR